MKKAIYSVITNGYDRLPNAPRYEGWDTIMFIDDKPENNKGWEIRVIGKSKKPVLQSREYKILSHVHLPEYDMVCYVDANQKMLQAPSDHPIRFYHPKRQDIFQEAAQIIKNGRFPAEEINEQISYYIKQGYRDQGLFLNGYSVRSNRDERINRLHDVWYEETARFTPRDQLSLPYAIYKTGIKLLDPKGPQIKERFAIVERAHNEKVFRKL